MVSMIKQWMIARCDIILNMNIVTSLGEWNGRQPPPGRYGRIAYNLGKQTSELHRNLRALFPPAKAAGRLLIEQDFIQIAPVLVQPRPILQ
jgi:hypothetical protein